MKTVSLTVAEADVPFILNAIRNYANSMMVYIHNEAVPPVAPSSPAAPTGTVTLPKVKLSKNGKRLGRPPKGAK